MTNTDKITELTTFYYSCLYDHHKDRDCHFYISSRWSYSDFKGFYVEHNGYLYEYTYTNKYYKTYEDAEKELIRFLKYCIESILKTDDWEGSEWEWCSKPKEWFENKRANYAQLLERIRK